VHAPEIIHADKLQGFLLLTDFGSDTYLKTLHADNAGVLYERALNALARIQSCKAEVPPFTADFMCKEWDWHKEWVLDKWLSVLAPSQEVDVCYEYIVESAVQQPQVFMHRDYHSANLMMLANQDVGVLDFQDAFVGPLTYDAVSLLRDCYIAWPQERVQHWALMYARLLRERGLLTNIDDQMFMRWFDLMGVQRHLKALLTFARKHVRDQQSQYLNHVPRTLSYLLNVLPHYPELNALNKYVSETVQPAIQRVMS
jgi:aminoglycoside/choline kinase family phosphotransferase